jgi:F0F1-type ATP synthase alpha subunit
MQLNPSEISELIKSKIENLAISADLRTQGTVVSVTDGICRIYGLTDVMQGEMLEFPGQHLRHGLEPRPRLGWRGGSRRVRADQ